jgi:hypothetical protein
MKPDICFGYRPDEIDDYPIAEDMGDFFGIVGYERTAGLLSRIFTVLETGRNEESKMDMYSPEPS